MNIRTKIRRGLAWVILSTIFAAALFFGGGWKAVTVGVIGVSVVAGLIWSICVLADET